MKYGLDNIQNLIAACTIGDAAAAERFLDEGASPNGVRLVDGASAVYIASWHGHAEIIRLLDAARRGSLDTAVKTPLDAIYYDTAPHEHCNPNNSNLNRLLDSYLPSHWKLRVALTFGRLTGRDAELAGHRIAPLIGSFVVGDVLLRKKN